MIPEARKQDSDFQATLFNNDVFHRLLVGFIVFVNIILFLGVINEIAIIIKDAAARTEQFIPCGILFL